MPLSDLGREAQHHHGKSDVTSYLSRQIVIINRENSNGLLNPMVMQPYLQVHTLSTSSLLHENNFLPPGTFVCLHSFFPICFWWAWQIIYCQNCPAHTSETMALSTVLMGSTWLLSPHSESNNMNCRLAGVKLVFPCFFLQFSFLNFVAISLIFSKSFFPLPVKGRCPLGSWFLMILSFVFMSGSIFPLSMLGFRNLFILSGSTVFFWEREMDSFTEEPQRGKSTVSLTKPPDEEHATVLVRVTCSALVYTRVPAKLLSKKETLPCKEPLYCLPKEHTIKF